MQSHQRHNNMHVEMAGNLYEAVAFDAPWNGFATPTFTRATLLNLIADLTQEIAGNEADKTILTLNHNTLTINNYDGDHPETITANIDGTFNLTNLGWAFTYVTDDELNTHNQK
jgi:hypothetical protein